MIATAFEKSEQTTASCSYQSCVFPLFSYYIEKGILKYGINVFLDEQHRDIFMEVLEELNSIFCLS